MSAISKRVVRELRNKEFRDEYVATRVKRWIATQIKTMRTQEGREWSQGELADKLGTAQGNVSRIESPDYGKFTLQTLLEIAEAFDVALQVKFVDHITFLTSTSDMSPDRMTVQSYGPQMETLMGRVFNVTPEPSMQVIVSASSVGVGAIIETGGTTERVEVSAGSDHFPVKKIIATESSEYAQ